MELRKPGGKLGGAEKPGGNWVALRNRVEIGWGSETGWTSGGTERPGGNRVVLFPTASISDSYPVGFSRAGRLHLRQTARRPCHPAKGRGGPGWKTSSAMPSWSGRGTTYNPKGRPPWTITVCLASAASTQLRSANGLRRPGSLAFPSPTMHCTLSLDHREPT